MGSRQGTSRGMDVDEVAAKIMKIIDPDTNREVTKTNKPKVKTDLSDKVQSMGHLLQGHMVLAQIFGHTPAQ